MNQEQSTPKSTPANLNELSRPKDPKTLKVLDAQRTILDNTSKYQNEKYAVGLVNLLVHPNFTVRLRAAYLLNNGVIRTMFDPNEDGLSSGSVQFSVLEDGLRNAINRMICYPCPLKSNNVETGILKLLVKFGPEAHPVLPEVISYFKEFSYMSNCGPSGLAAQAMVAIGHNSPLVEQTFKDCIELENSHVKGDGKLRCPIVSKTIESYFKSSVSNSAVNQQNYPDLADQMFGLDRSATFNYTVSKEET